VNISEIKNLKKQFKSKAFRDSFIEQSMASKLALQIRALREQRGWTQEALAEKAGMKQARISELENPNYGRISISTLKRLASAFDTALDVSFTTFGEALELATRNDDQKLFVCSFADDIFFSSNEVVATHQVSMEPIPRQVHSAVIQDIYGVADRLSNSAQVISINQFDAFLQADKFQFSFDKPGAIDVGQYLCPARKIPEPEVATAPFAGRVSMEACHA
jgi:transcriptional regulator with XRE-family HTH domain